MKQIILIVALCMLLAIPVFAQIPQTLSYQGVLTDVNGEPITTTGVKLTFRIHTNPDNSAVLWQEVHESVLVENGVFNVILGSQMPLDLPFNSAYFLGISIGEDEELLPLIELTSAAYSLNARSVEDSSVTAAQIAGGTVVRSLNGLTEAVELEAGDNVSITSQDSRLVISAVGGAGGGDIMEVIAGQGLTGGGSSTDVTLALADSGVVGKNIAGSQVVRSLNGLRDDLKLAAEGGATLTTRGDTLVISAGSGTGSSGWTLQGNVGTDPQVNFLGTTDSVALELRVNSQRVLRLERGIGESPNVIGGNRNEVSNGVVGATIGGGGSSFGRNRVSDDYGTVGGGQSNEAGDDEGAASDRAFATVSGGINNRASGSKSTISGGSGNFASSELSTVGGGGGNVANGDKATIAGGENNRASGDWTTIGGGADNDAGGTRATIGGGQTNAAGGVSATIGGGEENVANNTYATIGGGSVNQARGFGGTVAGGLNNIAGTVDAHRSATVGGGSQNQAIALGATVSGGSSNIAEADESGFATVAGGEANRALNDYTVVSGGEKNVASGPHSVVSGGLNNLAFRKFATVPGGFENQARGNFSLAAGHKARAIHNGSFVWNDQSVLSGKDSLVSTAANQFLIRAGGGVGIGTNAPNREVTVFDNDADGEAAINIKASNSSSRELLLAVEQSTGGILSVETNNPLSIRTNAVERVRVTSSGNVGIGTATPNREVTVFDNDNDGDAAINLKASNSSDRELLLAVNQSTGGILSVQTNNPLSIRTNAVERLRVTNAGNVGIGTSNPADKLDVRGDINALGEVRRDDTGSANMVPICYGNVASNGVINTGSGNFSVTKPTTGEYLITIANENFIFSKYIVSATPVTQVLISYGSVSGKLKINMEDASGNVVDRNFSFVVYKP